MRNAGDDKRIQEIINEYWKLILIRFKNYKDDMPLKIKDDMKRMVYFLSDDECREESEFSELNGSCVGRYMYDTDEIFFIESGFFKQTPERQKNRFIHEYIHRLARGQDEDSKWISGLDYGWPYTAFNEMLTEYFTTTITGWYDEKATYNLPDKLFDRIVNGYGVDSLGKFYFHNDKDGLDALMGATKKPVLVLLTNILYYTEGKDEVNFLHNFSELLNQLIEYHLL